MSLVYGVFMQVQRFRGSWSSSSFVIAAGRCSASLTTMRPARYHRLATIRDLDEPTAGAAVVFNKASSLALSILALYLIF